MKSKVSIDFVLARPQFPGNTGSVARALKNCAFEKLVLVNPAFEKNDLEAIKYAVGAKNVLQKAKVYDDFQKAMKPYQLVIGTSRRKGNYRKNVISLDELPSLIETINVQGKIAILFGTETSGLSNEEFKLCQHLVYIPSNPEFESFNLSQAVLLVAHELFRRKPKKWVEKAEKYPTTKELEGMYGHLTDMLSQIGFMKNDNIHHIPRILRNIFNRAHLTDVEVRVIRGICRQVLWFKEQKQSKV